MREELSSWCCPTAGVPWPFSGVCNGCALELLPRETKISKSLLEEQKPHSCHDPFAAQREEAGNLLTLSQQDVTCL